MSLVREAEARVRLLALFGWALFGWSLSVASGCGSAAAAQETSGSCDRIQLPTHRLHACQYGLDNAITVLLDSGAREDSRAWAPVIDELQTFAHVIAYDRAGLGQSDPGPEPRTVSRMAEEMRALVDELAPTGRIILVGHSAGGWRVRRFAELYPDRVAGLLLLDSPHEDFEAFRLSTLTERERAERQRSLAASRMDLPRGVQLEYEGMADVGTELNGHLPDVPLVVVSAGVHGWVPEDRAEVHEEGWRRLQRELAGTSTGGRYVLAESSGHSVQRDNPALVVELIRGIAERAAR